MADVERGRGAARCSRTQPPSAELLLYLGEFEDADGDFVDPMDHRCSRNRADSRPAVGHAAPMSRTKRTRMTMNQHRTPLEAGRAMRALAAAGAVAAAVADQQPGAGAGPKRCQWSELGKDEQRVLAAHADSWQQLDASTQDRLLRGARRWLSLTPEQRAAAAKRFTAWQGLPDERRQQIRNRYQAFRNLPPEQQQQLKRQFERFRYLPPEQREELKRRFENMTPQERRGFLTALRATQQAENARNFYNRIPEQDRAATRAMIESLTQPERQKLRRLMQASTPEQRRELHQRVLAMSAEERSRWLAEQP